jgi:hypothetical protein
MALVEDINWSSSDTVEMTVFLSTTSGLAGKGAGINVVIFSASYFPNAFNSGV